MPVAAIPRYLGADFGSASAALRFGMYLKLWGVDSRTGRPLWKTHDVNYRQAGRERKERRFEDENKSPALKSAAELNESDRQAMAALSRRQQAVFQTVAGDAGLELIARSVAPFTTGLGNEHPLENGFSFLNPYGLPYLPGSGVKGVVRRAAEELTHRDFFENDSGWTLPAIWHLFGFERWTEPSDKNDQTEWKEWVDGFAVGPEEVRAYLDAVLDDASTSGKKLRKSILDAPDPWRALLCERQLHVRGALEFWDVVPQVDRKKALGIEIMTPHHSHYYQARGHVGSKSPHDSGQPNPISFLTVPPDAGFTFRVRCDRGRLRYAPELATGDHWKALLRAAFDHAFEWLGFGAKTAVGYGAMRRDRQAEDQAARKRDEAERTARETREREKRLAALSPVERTIEEILDSRRDKSAPEISAILKEVENGRWDGAEKVEAARWLKSRMQEAGRWKECSKKKNPDKDKNHQATLRVMSWLES